MEMSALAGERPGGGDGPTGRQIAREAEIMPRREVIVTAIE